MPTIRIRALTACAALAVVVSAAPLLMPTTSAAAHPADITTVTVSDPVGDLLRHDDPNWAQYAARVADTDLSGVTYTVRRSGPSPALTIAYRTASARPDKNPTREFYGTFIGQDEYVEVHSKRHGAIELLDHHRSHAHVPCAGGSETRDSISNTVTQTVPLACLRAVHRVRAVLSSWTETHVSFTDSQWSVDATAPTGEIRLNAAGYPASVKVPHRHGPRTVTVHPSAPGLDHANPASTEAQRRMGDLSRVDIRIDRATLLPQLTIVYHVGTVIGWTPRTDATAEQMTQSFTVVIDSVDGLTSTVFQDSTIGGVLTVWHASGGDHLIACHGATEVRDAAAHTVTQSIPLACLTPMHSPAHIQVAVRAGHRFRAGYVRDTAARTRGLPLSSITTR